MFEEHYEAVLRYAWRRVGATDASDVAAETFRIAWEKRSRCPVDKPLPWLYATARNVTQNLRRRERRREALPLHEDAASETDHAGAVVNREAAIAALNTLKPADRELVLLVSWEGLDLRQAAAVVGITRAAAGMRLHRARDHLRRALAGTPEPAAYEERFS